MTQAHRAHEPPVSMVTEEWLRSLAGRAATLAERARGDVMLEDPADDATRTAVARRWRHWRAIAAGGDDTRFARRLRWDGIDPGFAQRLLGPARLPDDAALPSWADTLRHALTMTSPPGSGSRRCLDPQEPWPFENVLVPFVAAAADRLRSNVGPAALGVGQAVHVQLERRLIRALSQLASRTLFHEFRARHPDTRGGFDRLLVSLLPHVSATVNYDAFVSSLLDHGLPALLNEYPVLGRLLATTVDAWVATGAEFLTRLAYDRRAIRDAFCSGIDPGPATTLDDVTSDPHNGGRSVLALSFESGLRLVYKPKSLATERCYFALLDWLNGRGTALPLRVLTVLERDGYGWAEYVEQRACPDGEGVARYYRRAGSLAGLLHVLGATDCHFENVVASGDQPVLVDLETLLQPAPVSVGEVAIDLTHTTSVLTTGLLPFWLMSPDGRAYDASGLGGLFEHPVVDEPGWQRMNTDDMALIWQASARPRRNRVTVGGAMQSPHEYRHEILRGFHEMCGLLRAHHGVLLAADGPLRALECTRVRFVFRPTELYRRALSAALEPDCLRDGADRSIALDQLSAPLLHTETPHPFWRLRAAEQDALDRLDVPHFSVAADATGMNLPTGHEVEGCFAVTAIQRLRSRLMSLDDTGEALQTAFINASLSAARRPAPAGDTSASPGRAANAPALLTRDELLHQSVRIARELEARAVRRSDGSAFWVGVSFTPHVERYDLRPLGFDLYNGAGGIALFLAAVAHVTGGAGFRDLALAGLRPLTDALHAGSPDVPELRSIGGGWGLGSIIYALARTARLLEAPNLLDAAARAAALITPGRIEADRDLDVLSGSAGALLGLLSLHASTADRQTLDRAMLCGHQLLAHRTPADTGLPAWRTLQGRHLTGFSHGAAGIAYALLRLYAVTHDEGFLRGALAGFEYERSQLSTAAGNWRDLRVDRPDAFMTTWCHGAPGIALSRTGALAITDIPSARVELDIALRTSLACGLDGPDHLCCGNAGRADILREAGIQLARPELVNAARRQLSAMAAAREAAGGWRLVTGLPPTVFNPGLFRGAAGIGYTLLRTARPGVLPSILLWNN